MLTAIELFNIHSPLHETQSYASCCGVGDTQLNSVKIYFIFNANSYWTVNILYTVINTQNKQHLCPPNLLLQNSRHYILLMLLYLF